MLIHCRCARAPRLFAIPLVLSLCSAPAWAQSKLSVSNGIHLYPSDEAILAGFEDRNDLDCSMDPLKPAMGFDLRFLTGYTVGIPLKELAGRDGRLRVLARVTPVDQPDNVAYLTQHIPVPAIEEDAKGDAQIPGEFVVGPGRYKVDWLIRDRRERACSAHWDIEATPRDEYEGAPLAIAPNTVEERPGDPFHEEPPVARDPDHPLYVRLLINFSPGDPSQAVLNSRDIQALMSILRSIAREPRFGRFSVVAFSTDEERVLYRQDVSPRIDFPALGQVVDGLNTGVISLRQLRNPDSATAFLTGLLTENLTSQQPAPDAVIIVSAKVMLDKNPSEEALRAAGAPPCPVFYMNYNANPRRNPWRDAISAGLKAYRGLVYSITLPRDLGSALGDMMLRLNGNN